MTAREKKAVQMTRKSGLVKLRNHDVRFMSDEELLQSGACQGYIEMADWMAEQCTNEFTKFHAERYPHTTQSTHDEYRILNAGREEIEDHSWERPDESN